jgi:hypothetical protein
MNGKQIHTLANELTEAQVENILANWQETEDKALENFKSLVRLGDSRELAVATAISQKYRNDASEVYRVAYES